MTITFNAAGAGETWTAGGGAFRASRGRQRGRRACTLAPGWTGPPQHIHREHDESFFILAGTVRFTSGLDVGHRALVTAPIGEPHADDQAPATLLCTRP